jgi:hypothetical protein
MEDLLRQAFQLGQQWVQDVNNDKQPVNFNQWFNSSEIQKQINNILSPERKLLIALRNIEKCCNNNNPTHKEIWCIAYDAIMEETYKK